MRRILGVAAVLLGVLTITALPARAQTGSDVPGGCVHQVTGLGELPNSTASAPTGGTVWRAMSLALQQNLSLGLWRWLPVNTDPSARIVTPNLLTPRRPLLRVGGWSRP